MRQNSANFASENHAPSFWQLCISYAHHFLYAYFRSFEKIKSGYKLIHTRVK